MDLDEQLRFLHRHHQPLEPTMDLEDHDDFEAVESRVSVVSSEWGNVSSASSSSSAENQFSAKDIVNWREFWDIWSSYHRVIAADVRSVPSDHPLSQEIYAVFQSAYSIPRSRFYVHSAENSCAPELQNYLAQIVNIDPSILSDDAAIAIPQANNGNGLAVAALALEIHQTASRLAQEGDTLSDDQWTTQIHDALIVRCARGRLLGPSEAWSQPKAHHSDPHADASPTAARILSVRKIRPHGSIPVPTSDEMSPSINSHMHSFFAAAFSTRSQIASHLRDTPESVSLHSYSVMTTRAVLAQLSTFGINMPVFGIMFDRHVVRFHVDWSVSGQNHDATEQVSVPLPQTDHALSNLPPFRDFDLTAPVDSLRVAFLLDAIHSYARCRLAPAVSTVLASWQRTSGPIPRNLSGLPVVQDEISSEEKVQAWMQSGAVDAVGESD